MTQRQERLGRNETLFREVNERLEKLQAPFDVFAERAEFVCECGNRDCTKQITMSLKEYEDLRSDPTYFAVVPGHEVPDVEDIVARREGYDVVRKREGPPADVAIEEDPRS
jgi:hypothetical protein